MYARHLRACPVRARAYRPRSQPESSTTISDALELGEPAEDDAGVHREPDRLVERGGREVEIEKAIGIAPVAVEVPVARVEQIEAAELEPGSAVVGGGGEIAAEQVDGHLALALPLEGGGPGRHVRVDGRLGAERPSAQAQRGGHAAERRRAEGAGPRAGGRARSECRGRLHAMNAS